MPTFVRRLAVRAVRDGDLWQFTEMQRVLNSLLLKNAVAAVGGQTIRHPNQSRTCHHGIVSKKLHNPDGEGLVLRKCSHL